MSLLTISVPYALTLHTAFQFCAELEKCTTHDEYVLDFSKTQTIEPFGMLLISSEIQRCISINKGSKFSCTNYNHMTYAGHMGFFKAFGLDFGKNPGQANGGKNYIPMTIFETESLIKDAAATGREVGDEIEAQSKRLTETLISQDSGDIFQTLSYSIREIMRNVVEHAQTDKFGICSQYWPSKGRAEVAIFDRGIGLLKSLASNPHIDASDDKKAINYALMPAVSGKAFKGSPKQRTQSHWVNSGFGLYMTSRICRNGGNFFISSGKKGMLLTSGKEGKRYFDTSLTGTAVRMVIQTNQIAELKNALARYRDEGYEIQKKYKEIVNIDPSAASLMLSEDFDLGVWNRILQKIKSVI
jgi:hypothetical protein